MNEVIEAMNFAAQNNLKFEALYAFINDFERLKKYLKNELSYAELKKASEDLILYYYQERIANVPEGYLCPQYNLLTIDQDCKIITCCGDNTHLFNKEIYLLSPKEIAEINKIRMNSSVCDECIKLGMHHIGAVFPNYIMGINR